MELELELARANITRLEAELAAREAEAKLTPSGHPAGPDGARLERELARLRAQMTLGAEEVAAARREIERLRGTAGAGVPSRAHPEFAAARARLAELEKEAAEARLLQARVEDHRGRVRELEQVVSALAVALDQTKADVSRAAASRAWRYGHGFTRLLSSLALRKSRTQGALARALQRIEQVEQATLALPAVATGRQRLPQPLPSPAQTGPPTGEDRVEAIRSARAELASEIRQRLGAPPQHDAWPAVSIVVVNRDGRRHLEWLVRGLTDATDYPDFELVVFDNGSTDDSIEYLETLVDARFEIVIERHHENLTFSAANARGAVRARHDLLLFLNNDIEPFEPGWLRELVAAFLSNRSGAVGGTLLHVEEISSAPTLQHRGIRFRLEHGLPRAFNDGDGDEMFGAQFGREEHVPAVTAACLLIGRDSFEAVGGFGDGYRYGSEDVDLCLKLIASGKSVVATGRAIAFHRESSTQIRQDREVVRANREINRRVLHERWGARLWREYRLARLNSDPAWADGTGPHVAITVTSTDVADGWGDWYTAHEMGDALSVIGWRVSYVARKGDAWLDLPDDVDYVLSLMDTYDLRNVPDHVTAVAWIRNWTERWLEREWFDRADVILASSQATAEWVARKTGRTAVHFPLATNPTRFTSQTRSAPAEPSDYVFTGNRWGEKRAIEDAFHPIGKEDAAIYGRDWHQVKRLKRYHRGVAGYEELPSIYASSKLVLDDTQGPTLPYGAVNARVFDALAAGTLVVTNCETGVRELFDDDFPVWTSRESLRAQLDNLLANDERRTELARRYQAQVLAEHTYAHRASRLVEVLREEAETLSFCIKIGAPDAVQATRWGDLYFARAIRKELRRRGHRCRIQTLDQWELLDGLTDDVVIHLKGLSRYQPKPGQFNVLWCISHPNELRPEECDGYDLVCIASKRFASEMARRTATTVVTLEQATDPEVFYPDFDPAFRHELVYVANSRNVLRPIPRDMLPTDRDLAIWGANWNGLIDDRYVVGEHIPNEEVRKAYSSASVVLADHWDDMREHGFISNRIYDALACGAVVVSDDVPGLRERFGNAIAVYRNADDLKALIDELTTSSSLATMAAGATGRQQVLANGTFEARVDELLHAVASARDASPLSQRVRPVHS